MDQRLADLRRRVALAEPGARAQLLAERLRIGDLTRERLELAAYVGDEDARAVAGVIEDEGSARLEAWGRDAVLRAGAAALRVGGANDERSAAFERWILCPCSEHWTQAARFGGLVFALMNLTASDGHHAFVLHSAWRDERVRAAIRNDVAPWALGERDPVRERVDAAGQA